MDIRQLNSYVREKAGSPSPAVLKSEEITLQLLSEITSRQSQMIQASKPVRTLIETLKPTSRSGSITFESGGSGADQNSRPDYARVRSIGQTAWSLLQIAPDVESLANCEASGISAILLYGDPLVYELSFEPNQTEIELWFDKEVSSLSAIAAAGSGLPAQFDFMIGAAAAIKCMPTIVRRDESARVWAEFQTQILERELVRFEYDWQQFLYQSVSAGRSTRKTPFRVPTGGRRLRGFPY